MKREGDQADAHAQVHLRAGSARLVRNMALVVGMLSGVVLLHRFASGLRWYDGATVPGIAVAALCLVLLHGGHLQWAISLLLWSMALLPVFLGLSAFGMGAPGLMVLPVAVMAAAWLLPARHSVAMAAVAAVLCVTGYALVFRGVLAVGAVQPLYQLLALLGTMVIGLFIGLYGARALRAELVRVRAAEQAQHRLNLELESRVTARTAELTTTLQELRQTQFELVQSEKLAALGAMVTGIAHELNTPVGNAMMVVSTLAEQQRELERKLAHGLKRSVLDQFLYVVRDGNELLERSLQRTADLVATFKQVAVDQSSAHRSQFMLDEVLPSIMLTCRPTLERPGIRFTCDVAPGLEMDSYSGPLGQVLITLLGNAMKHAFEGCSVGQLQLRAHALGDDWVRISVTDDGVGIPRYNLPRVFDPFFTTKLGQGGSGLGLHIAHNIVTGMLGGRIQVRSEAGQGSEFCVELPRRAPCLSL